jgi:hypothetical protein
MSDEFDENGDPIEAPSGESAAKTLRAQNKKLAADLAAAQEAIAAFSAKERKSTIASVLEAKGANPKLAKYVDVEGDVTAESVAKWLEDEGEIFGYKAPDPDADGEFDERIVQQQRVSAASAGALPPPSGMTPERLRQMSTEQLVAAGYLNPK